MTEGLTGRGPNNLLKTSFCYAVTRLFFHDRSSIQIEEVSLRNSVPSHRHRRELMAD